MLLSQLPPKLFFSQNLLRKYRNKEIFIYKASSAAISRIRKQEEKNK
jgi:hypothetical protein